MDFESTVGDVADGDDVVRGPTVGSRAGGSDGGSPDCGGMILDADEGMAENGSSGSKGMQRCRSKERFQGQQKLCGCVRLRNDGSCRLMHKCRKGPREKQR